MDNKISRRSAAALLAASILAAPAIAFAAKLTPVRITIDEDPIAVAIAQSLGYFAKEGIEIVPIDLEKLTGEDYLMQEPLMKGRIDASYHWFNHTIYGAKHGFPVQAVMVFNDAPGMRVLVANRVKDQVRSPVDFKGRNVAEGAGYGTKSVVTHYLTARAGLPPDAYTPVMLAKEGRTEAVIQGLKDGDVDVMTFEEPVVSKLMATHMVTPLLDMTSRASTEKVLGAWFPAQTLMVSPQYAQAHPDTVQHLVNAFVRAMRFINAHSVDEIVAKLPPDYFRGKDRAAEVQLIRDTISTQANGNYAFSPAAVDLVVRMNLESDFDKSDEGQWRAGGDKSNVVASKLYTNRFVEAAMKAIP
jgi:NitT/TauT family transport system substrate-binding protein